MGTSSNNGNFCKNGSDRISNLPDPLLHRILSFLKTKEVVRAGILAKRWRGLWASIPTLDFNDRDDFHNDPAWTDFEFENFVDTVLLFRQKSSLDRFSLICRDYSGWSHITRWICYALSCNTKVLEVTILAEKELLLPQCIFESHSLEELVLSLDDTVDLTPPKFTNRLRKLTLNRIYFPGILEQLVSACPFLEEFFLSDSFLGEVDISSASLKLLAISKCDIEDLWISTPSLLSLTLLKKTFVDTSLLLNNLSSLLDATVPANCGLQPLAGLVNARIITLTQIKFAEGEEFSEEELLRFPKFNNLESLTLCGEYSTKAVQMFVCFLRHSPNLRAYEFLGKSRRIV